MIRIKKSGSSLHATVALTPSKSITNRLYIIQAICKDKFEIRNASLSDDSLILNSVLKKITGDINVNDAGTAFRFLTALLSIKDGSFNLTGSERMKQRPIGSLVSALKSIGAEIGYVGIENYPPLRINGKALKGGNLIIDASESSQFISALLLIAPALENGLSIQLDGKIYSMPYVEMTISLMKFFGVEVLRVENKLQIAPQPYKGRDITVENDWSSASFWYASAVMSNEAEIVLKGLVADSLQGDSVIREIMKHFGIHSEISGNDIIIRKGSNEIRPSTFEYDFSSCPDLVIPVAVACSAIRVPATMKGVKNLRIKESDRLQSLKNELSRIGTEVIIGDDTIQLKSEGEIIRSDSFKSHNDHRMSMSIAFLSNYFGEVMIDDHLTVNKSYPEFWKQLENAGYNCEII